MSSSRQHNNKLKMINNTNILNVILFPLHVSIPIGSLSGGLLIHLKFETAVTEFAKLLG
jgi:hypothetical protein